MPYAAYKLLRLMRYMELPGESWQGWHFSRGVLVTPEGRTLTGKDGNWWSMLVLQASSFAKVYDQRGRLMSELLSLQGLPVMAGSAADRNKGGPGTGGTWGGRRDAPDSEAGRAAQPPANLLIEHFTTNKNQFGVKPSSLAINSVANH